MLRSSTLRARSKHTKTMTSNPQERIKTLTIPANRLVKAFDWIDEAAALPSEYVVAIRATLWLQQVDAFRDFEEDCLVTGVYDAQLDLHRSVLSRLIADGESLVFMATRVGAIKFPSGCTLEDIKATIDALHVTFRGQYGPKNSQQTNDAIAKLLEMP